MVTRKQVPEAPQKCPECDQEIKFKVDPGEALMVVNIDGTPHICPYEEEPWHKPRKTAFADVMSKIGVGFTLRDRQLSLNFADGTVLEVYGIGRPPLKLRLITKDRVLEE